MVFVDESKFEEEVIKTLQAYKWENDVLAFRTEQDLIDNWANILFQNNREQDRLNGQPLTKGEMGQIMQRIRDLRTPLKLNGFINGKSVIIKRDNEKDKLHYGKEVSLKIYDRMEIAAGQSRYQIAQQTHFNVKDPLGNNRRGDLTLLINGMPVIHIELKRSGVPVSQACGQIEKYAHEGVFTGLFSLVQVFVGMTPEETVYFANPGPDGVFNEAFYFHWADFNNERIDDWQKVVATLLSIPTAHELIGFYTVADDTDATLKVMRSYQYYAATSIWNATRKHHWDLPDQRGGYVWHTTGSGKTMTSFKSAQLIAAAGDADKVVFLMDRIELGTQSLLEYRGFANEDEPVQATENSDVLLAKLRSDSPSDTLIVTSIQKMSRIKEEGIFRQNDIDRINAKRMVIIVDECHRSTFGEMLYTIKTTFQRALFFGFSGTPIFGENSKGDNTTADVFGNELHRYSIADGIRDGNVLGFDPYKISTYSDRDLRQSIALEQAKASSEADVYADPSKTAIYNRFMTEVPMAGKKEDGKYVRGIEDYLPTEQYSSPSMPHHEKVVEDIVEKWMQRSSGGKLHAIFATASIQEAVEYLRLFRERAPHLHVFGQFDPNIDNTGSDASFKKEEALLNMLREYNAQYHTNFTMASFDAYKKDVALRLAHKKPYSMIETNRDEQIDILVVVNQMLTGFDSKWVNTLYLDKVLDAENIIQAFSRTNRIFRDDIKPHGTICYYRKVHTMEQKINDALQLYSGNRPFGIFVSNLKDNLKELNELYDEIKQVFESTGHPDFASLPDEEESRQIFVKLFNSFDRHLQSAKIQGFRWQNILPPEAFGEGDDPFVIHFDEPDYISLVQRYKEIERSTDGSDEASVPYDIRGHITEIQTERIDRNYIEGRFTKYCKALQEQKNPEIVEGLRQNVAQSFASLSKEDQKYAHLVLDDVSNGNLIIEEGKGLIDYIVEYKKAANDDKIHRCAEQLGVDEEALRAFFVSPVTESNINDFSRFDSLVDNADLSKAKTYFEDLYQEPLKPYVVRRKLSNYLRTLILTGLRDF